MKGFDCATPLTAGLARQFKADGMDFVIRYLVPSGAKRLTRSEATAIGAAGLLLGSVFETTAARALAGYQAGLADGRTALTVAAAVGQPVGSCIYFAVDFEPTTAQLQTVVAYIRGASEATPDYFTGVYGNARVLDAARVAGACSRFWQTTSWSYGKRAEVVHILQYRHDTRVNGIGIDFNDSYGSEGFWFQDTPIINEQSNDAPVILPGTGASPPAAPVPAPTEPAPGGGFPSVLNGDAASKVVGLLSALYTASPDPEVQTAAHYAADELRMAAGLTLDEENTAPGSTVTPSGAQKVIALLSSLYFAAPDEDVQAAAHYAANRLRDAGGLPAQED